MSIADLLALFGHFLLLSSMAVGGTNTVMPDMYRYVVDEHAWITARQFADVYTIAQASPGPNAMYVTLIGLEAAGWQGAVATTLALYVPATAFALVAVALSAGRPDGQLALALRRGLAPIALGFVLSSGWLLLRTVNHDWGGYLVTLVAVLVVLNTRVNPLWLMAAGAVAGIAGLV